MSASSRAGSAFSRGAWRLAPRMLLLDDSEDEGATPSDLEESETEGEGEGEGLKLEPEHEERAEDEVKIALDEESELAEMAAEFAESDEWKTTLELSEDVLDYLDGAGLQAFRAERPVFAEARAALQAAYAADAKLEGHPLVATGEEATDRRRLAPCDRPLSSETCAAQWGLLRARGRTGVLPIFAFAPSAESKERGLETEDGEEKEVKAVPRCLYQPPRLFFGSGTCAPNPAFWTALAAQIERYAPPPLGTGLEPMPVSRVVLAPYAALVYELVRALPGVHAEWPEVRDTIDALLVDQQMLAFYGYYRLWHAVHAGERAVTLSAPLLAQLMAETDRCIRARLPLGVRVFLVASLYDELAEPPSPLLIESGTTTISTTGAGTGATNGASPAMWSTLLLLLAFLPSAAADVSDEAMAVTLGQTPQQLQAYTRQQVQTRVQGALESLGRELAATERERHKNPRAAEHAEELRATLVAESDRADKAQHNLRLYEAKMLQYLAEQYPELPPAAAYADLEVDDEAQMDRVQQTLDWISTAIAAAGRPGASLANSQQLVGTLRALIQRDLGRNIPLFNAFRDGDDAAIDRILHASLAHYQQRFAGQLERWQIDTDVLDVTTWATLLAPESLDFDRIFNGSVWDEVRNTPELVRHVGNSFQTARRIAEARAAEVFAVRGVRGAERSAYGQEQQRIARVESVNEANLRRLAVIGPLIQRTALWQGSEAEVRAALRTALNELDLPGAERDAYEADLLYAYEQRLMPHFQRLVRSFEAWTTWVAIGAGMASLSFVASIAYRPMSFLGGLFSWLLTSRQRRAPPSST